MTRIGLLGPLQVTHNGGTETPTAPKVRQVLALLAMRADTVVSTHQLVDELWESRPPLSASTTLQTYIYQLRKLPGLGDGQPGDGTPALVTAPGGYRLNTPPGCLDVRDFEQLARQGRRRLEAQEVAKAADLLRQALDVWRGRALGDLTIGPVLRVDTLRLEEKRYAVLQERIDADMLLGRHDRLVSELVALTADNSTRESLHAKLMLCLYRAGRRSEALEVFGRIRRLLSQELGLEPCPELQDLHCRILDNDPSLGLPRPQASVTTTRKPRASLVSLPPDLPLTGRDGEVTRIRKALEDAAAQNGTGCLSVTGPPGVGLTSVVTRAAHGLQEVFPDGVLYASFAGRSGSASASEVLADLLCASGHARDDLPESADDRGRLLRDWWSERRVLLVLDDVGSAGRLTHFAPVPRGSAMLVASHRKLHCGQHSTIQLPPLGQRTAVELLKRTLGDSRPLDNMHDALELYRLCCGLPGPLLQAASWLALRPHWSTPQFVDRIRHGLNAIGARHHELFRSVTRHCGELAPTLQDALAKLAATEEWPLSAERAAPVLGSTVYEAEDILEELVELHLARVSVRSDPGGTSSFRYTVLPVVSTALRNVLAPEPA